MRRQIVSLLFALALGTSLVWAPIPSGQAGENLVLNPKLDYNSDSQDGPLIAGDDMQNGELVAGKPTHIIIYGEG